MPKLGLRGKLVVFTLPVMAIVFAAVWWLSTRTTELGLRELADANARLSARNLADAITSIIDDTQGDAVTCARLDLAAQSIETSDPKNFDWYAEELRRNKRRYSAVIVTDADGTIVGAAPKSLIGKKVADDTRLADTKRAKLGQPVPVALGRPEFLRDALAANEHTFGFSVPVYDVVDEVAGSVTLLVSDAFVAERLQPALTRVGDAVDSAAFVIDRARSPVVLPSGLAAAPSGAYYTQALPIGGPFDWQLSVMNSDAAIQRPITTITRQLQVTFLLAAVVLGIVLAALMSRFILPLRQLSAAMAVADKAADWRPPAMTTSDEVSELGRTFTRLMGTIGAYERELEHKVEERTRQLTQTQGELVELLDNMRQGIFTINAEGRVNPAFSAFCRDLFGDVQIGGAPVLELLRLPPDEDSTRRMRFWLDHIFGTGKLQWLLAQADPVHEIAYGGGKIFELDYVPIYQQAKLHKVMVIARDVTETRDLRKVIAEQDAQLRRGSHLFATFIDELGQQLTLAGRALAALQANPKDDAAHAALFRAAHTVKGNARIFKATDVQAAAHALEDALQPVNTVAAATRLHDLRALHRDLTRVPLSELFAQIEAAGHDLASELGKQLAPFQCIGEPLRISGEDVKLLRTALVQALRNTIDHGIETPAERTAAGKPTHGRIILRGSVIDGALELSLTDDGRGVDLQRVRQKIGDRAERMNDDALLEELFTPGFSLAARVTSTSGRGVGLDVIRASLRERGGDATLSTTAGAGTQLTLRMPVDQPWR